MEPKRLLSEALEELEREHGEVVAERDAFLAFAEGIDGLSPARPSSSLVRARITLGRDAATLEDVRALYEKHVISLDHYGRVYLGSVDTELGFEFGDPIGGLLETETRLTPELLALFTDRARVAADRRNGYVELLDAERNAIRTYQQEYAALASPLEETTQGLEGAKFPALIELREDVTAAAGRCDDLLAERQESLHYETNGGVELNEILESVYQRLESPHPVLSTGVRLSAELQTARTQIEHRIATLT